MFVTFSILLNLKVLNPTLYISMHINKNISEPFYKNVPLGFAWIWGFGVLEIYTTEEK